MNSDKPWKRIKERAGLDGIHMHDLRRTFGTWPAPGGDTTQQIGKLMGHKSHITAKVYAEIAGGGQDRVGRADVQSDHGRGGSTKNAYNPLI